MLWNNDWNHVQLVLKYWRSQRCLVDGTDATMLCGWIPQMVKYPLESVEIMATIDKNASNTFERIRTFELDSFERNSKTEVILAVKDKLNGHQIGCNSY